MSRPSSSTARLFFLQTLSPLHVGVGEGTGHINLPTAREVTTQYPYVPGSSIKGVLREEAEIQNPPVVVDEREDSKAQQARGGDDPMERQREERKKRDRQRQLQQARYGDDPVVLAFGPPSSRAGDSRGGLVLTDARLLLLPMRSLVGGFALVTCPLILRRLAREAGLAGGSWDDYRDLTEASLANDRYLVGADSRLIHRKQVLLEDVRLKPMSGVEAAVDGLAEWLQGKAWDEADSSFYAKRLVVISDTLFGFFVRLHLEVRSRVHIDDDTGTAAASGPWLEEYIPAEAILFGIAQGRKTALRMSDPSKKKGQESGSEDVFQPYTARDSLSVLKKVVDTSPLLRFGGKSSGGAGRAFFRLATV